MKNKFMKCMVAACAIVMAGSIGASAAGLEVFNDYQDSDGTYAYYFDQGMIIGGLSEEWYQNTIMISDMGSAAFYHKASYDKYAKEGIENGGLLFSIGCSVNQDFKDLDEMTYIGFDEEECMNYYAVKPTDYTAYAKDEAIRQEYDALWKQTDGVIKNIRMVSKTEQEVAQTAVEPEYGYCQFAETDDFRVEIPKTWIWSVEDGMMFASATGSKTEPWMMVQELEGDFNTDELLETWKEEIKEDYQNRLAEWERMEVAE